MDTNTDPLIAGNFYHMEEHSLCALFPIFLSLNIYYWPLCDTRQIFGLSPYGSCDQGNVSGKKKYISKLILSLLSFLFGWFCSVVFFFLLPPAPPPAATVTPQSIILKRWKRFCCLFLKNEVRNLSSMYQYVSNNRKVDTLCSSCFPI